MTSVIGQVLPLAIAVALSTVPIVAAILILLSPAKPLVSIALLVGWAVGVAAILGLLTVGIRLIPESSPPRDDAVVGIFRILLGTALIVYPAVSWRTRSRRVRETPRWLDALGKINAIGALGFGFALALRPKNVILSIAAAVVIGDAELRVPDAVVVIAIFTIVGISTVALPIVGHFSAPEKTRAPLDATREWITRNTVTIMLVVSILMGVLIIGSGLQKF